MGINGLVLLPRAAEDRVGMELHLRNLSIGSNTLCLCRFVNSAKRPVDASRNTNEPKHQSRERCPSPIAGPRDSE